MGLLSFFKKNKLGVPSIPLLTQYFNVKYTPSDGFLYISKRVNTQALITDIPSSHKGWKKRFFFVSGSQWEHNPRDKTDTLPVPRTWSFPDNLGEFLFDPREVGLGDLSL